MIPQRACNQFKKAPLQTSFNFLHLLIIWGFLRLRTAAVRKRRRAAFLRSAAVPSRRKMEVRNALNQLQSRAAISSKDKLTVAVPETSAAPRPSPWIQNQLAFCRVVFHVANSAQFLLAVTHVSIPIISGPERT